MASHVGRLVEGVRGWPWCGAGLSGLWNWREEKREWGVTDGSVEGCKPEFLGVCGIESGVDIFHVIVQ